MSRSAMSVPSTTTFHSLKGMQPVKYRLLNESGTRTHACEETGALNQRLRPPGHLALTALTYIV
ncbi:unnamed protein product [Brugia pahangi]|uniref:MSP domain-containing protein n=1 Tax=Brugia pahangi TaxID=6280 RepID=A0A0N4TJL3_BRUPA|nr:unnamed protein product [Brugia pahangi]